MGVDRLRLGREVEHHRLVHVLVGEPLDLGCDRRAQQQQRLASVRYAAEDLFDVGAEPDIEHAVGLVEHDALQLGGVERTPAEVIEHTPRRADNDIRALLELGNLRADRLAAIDRHRANRATMTQLFDFVADLHGEFASWHENQRPGQPGAGLARHTFVDGAGERSRLPGAGPRLPQHVEAFKCNRDPACLDRAWLVVLGPAKRGMHHRRQLEVGEIDLRSGFGSMVRPRSKSQSRVGWALVGRQIRKLCGWRRARGASADYADAASGPEIAPDTLQHSPE